MDENCLFCTIANGEEGKLIWHNDIAAAFRDIHPKAPVHILVVPKKHIVNLNDLKDIELAGRLLLGVRDVAHQANLKDGWKLKVNNGRSAGQVVDHLHFHILGGAPFED